VDEGKTDQLVFFAFVLLFLNGKSTAQLPLVKRKEQLQRLFKKEIHGLRYSEHVVSGGPSFREHACKFGLEGVISKRGNQPYLPGNRGVWVKSKCLNREEFVVVGWTDPEGTRYDAVKGLCVSQPGGSDATFASASSPSALPK
jgi:bifunctional non-homologous end joining protein LigD